MRALNYKACTGLELLACTTKRLWGRWSVVRMPAGPASTNGPHSGLLLPVVSGESGNVIPKW